MKKERRKHTRIPGRFDALVTTRRKKIPLKTLNLSLRGMGCPGAEFFRQGEACSVRFTLSPGIAFAVKGIFVRAGGHDAGIYFTGIEPEGFYHLKRMVQYNAPDPDRIDRELALTHRVPGK